MTIYNNNEIGWHIWVISPSKFDKVKWFIDKYVEGVEEILYPTVTKEYRSKKGKILKKKVPLYSGYLFLKHVNSSKLLNTLNACPFITKYIGKCLGESLKDVMGMREVEKWNEDRNIEVGDEVLFSNNFFHPIFLSWWGDFDTGII